MSTAQEVSTKPKRSRRSRGAKEASGDASISSAPAPSKSTNDVPTEEQTAKDDGERKKRQSKRKQSDAAEPADKSRTVEKETVKESAPKVVEEVEVADSEKKKRKRKREKNVGADATVSEPAQEPAAMEPEAVAKDGEGAVAEGAVKKRKRSKKSDAAIGEHSVSLPAVTIASEGAAEHEHGQPTVGEKGKRKRRKSTKGEEAAKEPSIPTQPSAATQLPTTKQPSATTQPPAADSEQVEAPSKKSKKKAERKTTTKDDKKTAFPPKSDEPPQKAATTELKKAAPAAPPPAKAVDAAKDSPAKDAAPSKKAVKTSKKAAKPPSPEPEPEPFQSEEDPEDVAAAEDSDDEDVHLHGFSTDEDSSDEEMDGGEMPGIDVSTLPTIAKDDATVKRKLEKAKRQATEDRGVVYLGRIPHGFYEDQMKAYFSQFGNLTRLRLSRNKKTGRSKHYGFLEFDSSSVAQIVAETMDNYLLTGHILKCKVIPKDEVHSELWLGANRKWRSIPQGRIARVKHNKPRTEEEQVAAEKRLMQRQAARKRKLTDAGINYDFDAVAYKKKPKTVVS